MGLVGGKRRKALVAALSQCGDALGRRRMRPRRDDPVHIGALIDVASRGERRKLLVKTRVARAVIGYATGRVKLDGLERAEERPPQPETVFYCMIEIFCRNKTFTN